MLLLEVKLLLPLLLTALPRVRLDRPLLLRYLGEVLFNLDVRLDRPLKLLAA